MTRAQIRARVRYILKRYAQITFDDTEINDYINEGYTDFCVRTHCLRKHGTIAPTADTGIQLVPTDTLRIFRAEWENTLLEIMTTRDMDLTYGDGWRTTTGTDYEIIVQDNETLTTVRFYPILDTTNIGSSTIALDYSYLPTEMTTDSSTTGTPAILERYHRSLADFAVSRCLDAPGAQSEMNPPLGDRFYDRYMEAVNRARLESFHGNNVAITKSRVLSRKFI
jgi:hypothetical protein